MERFAAIAREIGALTGTSCALGPQRRVSGGSINECYLWPAAAGPMFVKLAPLERAAAHGFAELPAAAGERLLESVPVLLAAHRPAASLLHGDLWGGNWLASASGEPVLIDPAVYYGDRETDLAMTRLFGGFGERFYQAYQAAAPLAPAWEARAELYNLYHVLNHANLFGGGYARQARAMIERLLAQVRH